MAWFDRSSGERKGAETQPAKQAAALTAKPEPVQIPKPAAPADQPTAVASIVTSGPSPAERELVGHLYKGSRVSGQMIFKGPAQIDGSVEGEIQCHGTLTIGDAADVRAKIYSEVLIIRGKVEGNLTAKERVDLLAPGRVAGNISAPRLTVTEGVVFDGDCCMGVATETSAGSNSQAVSTAQGAPAQQSNSQK